MKRSDLVGSELAEVTSSVAEIEVSSPVAVISGLVFGSDTGLSADQVGGFMENVESGDLAVPILRLMQSQSPECQGKNAISKAGTFEISTLEVAVDADKEDLWFIPATFNKAWVERRAVGNGAPEKVAIYEREEDFDKSIYQFVQSKGAYMAQIDGSDHMIKLRHQHTGLVVIPSLEVITPCVIYATSTAIPNSKAFMAMYQGHATMVQGRRCIVNPSAQLFKITAEEKSNGQQTWFVPKFNRVKSSDGKPAYAPSQLTREALSLKQKVAESAVSFAEEEEFATVDVTADRIM